MACEYTEMWAMKMRKVFNSLDGQRKGKLAGLITDQLRMKCTRQDT